MNIESIRLGFRRICDWILKYLGVMMAIVLVAYGLVSLVFYQDHILYGLLIYIMPIICGLLIILDKHRSVFWAVGLYAIGIGVSRMLYYGPGIFDENIIVFVLNLILFGMAANLVYSGSRYLRGNARSIIFVLLGSTAFVVFTAIGLAIDFKEYGDDLGVFLDYDLQNIISMAVYLMYMGLVWSEPVRKSTNVAMALRLSSGIRGVDGTMKRASIPSYAVQGIVDYIEGKGSSAEGAPLEGPVYSEYCFAFHDNYTTNYASLQRWNGPDGNVYLILSDHNKGSFIGVKSMLVKGVRTIDDSLIIDCAEKGEAIFRIRDVDEEDGPITYGKAKEIGGDAA